MPVSAAVAPALDLACNLESVIQLLGALTSSLINRDINDTYLSPRTLLRIVLNQRSEGDSKLECSIYVHIFFNEVCLVIHIFNELIQVNIFVDIFG